MATGSTLPCFYMKGVSDLVKWDYVSWGNRVSMHSQRLLFGEEIHLVMNYSGLLQGTLVSWKNFGRRALATSTAASCYMDIDRCIWAVWSLSRTAADEANRKPMDFYGSNRFNSSARVESLRTSGSWAEDASRAGERRQLTLDFRLPLTDLGTRFLSLSSALTLTH